MNLCDATIQIGTSDPVSMQSLGLTLGARELVNMDIDTLTLTQSATRLSAGPVLTVDSRVKIYNAGVLWFTAHVGPIRRVISGGQIGYFYTLRGAWFVLSETLLWWRWDELREVDQLISYQWGLLKTHVATYAAGLVALPDYDTLPNHYQKPWRLATADIGTNVRSLLSDFLTAAVRWDYSQVVPMAQLAKLDSSPRSLILGQDEGNVIDIDLTRRDDLTPNKTVMRIVGNLTRVGGDTERIAGRSYIQSIQFADETGSGYDADNTGIGVANIIYYESDIYEKVKALSFYPEVKNAILNFVHSSLSLLIWEGQMILRGTSSGVRPGDTVSVQGADADMSTARMMVQSVSEDFSSQTTTVTVGLQLQGAETRSLADLTVSWFRWPTNRGSFPEGPLEYVAGDADDLPPVVPP